MMKLFRCLNLVILVGLFFTAYPGPDLNPDPNELAELNDIVYQNNVPVGGTTVLYEETE